MGNRIFAVAFLDLASSLVHFYGYGHHNHYHMTHIYISMLVCQSVYRNHKGTAAKIANLIL